MCWLKMGDNKRYNGKQLEFDVGIKKGIKRTVSL